MLANNPIICGIFLPILPFIFLFCIWSGGFSYRIFYFLWSRKCQSFFSVVFRSFLCVCLKSHSTVIHKFSFFF